MSPSTARGDQVGYGLTPVNAGGARSHQRVALVDLLDRLLAGGVVLAGDVTISIADVDLVRISLRALITSIRDGEGPAEGQGPS